ncbi:LOW QUALITY PROTEIN: two-component response regulator YvcP [Bacillus sp. JCM 19046]|nr:LOW QUALITY PROTEIN: two-component response regulator YvcP [Bacillus sp. JCM 19046]
MTKKIVIVEDDQRLSDLLREKLTRFQFDVVCHDGSSDLLFLIEKESPSLILLDVNLPSFDGFYWCNQIRLKTTCPILFISARDSNQDQVRALEMAETITQTVCDSASRKSKKSSEAVIWCIRRNKRASDYLGLILYKKKLLVEFKQERSPLSYKEANLLELVMSSYPEVVDRKKILATLWDESEFIDENTLSVNVTRVRKQLNSIKAPHQIIAVRGVGYRLKVGEP